jgi:hypothetical protein
MQIADPFGFLGRDAHCAVTRKRRANAAHQATPAIGLTQHEHCVGNAQ